MKSIKTLVWRPLKFLKSLISISDSGTDQPLLGEAYRTEEHETSALLDSLNLSPRVLNCLWKADIRKIETVSSMSDEDLLNIRGFGAKALTELKDRLANHYLLDANIRDTAL